VAVTVTDDRTAFDQGDSTTGWAAAGGSTSVALGTADPAPVEADGHIASTASNATTFVFFTGTSRGTGPHLIYVWALTTGVLDTRANGGLMLMIGDGTNRVGYHVGGSDVAPFRSDSGEAGTRTGYMCFVTDTDQLASWPHGATVLAGSRATLEGNLDAITQVGAGFKTLVKAVGGAVNIWVDIIRTGVANTISTSGLTLSGGTSGDVATFRQIAIEDRSSATVKAHGVIRELGEGLFGVQGTLRFGDQASGSSWFEDKNVTVVFEKRDLASTRYRVVITDNGTGTTTFKLGTKVGTGINTTGTDGGSIIAASGVGWDFDAATDADVTDVFVYGYAFVGASGGVKFLAGQEFAGGVISGSGQVAVNGALFVNNSVTGSTVAADASALLWDVNTDPDTLLHGTSVAKGTNAHHAIEFGTTSPLEMTLRNMTFSGFNASNGENDSTFHVKRTTGTVTINLVGTSGNVSYKSDGADVVLVQNPVTLTVTVRDGLTSSVVQGAYVLALADDGSGFDGGATVTITSTGGTATVAHTSHGYATGNKVRIRGAEQPEYNGIQTITVTGAGTYTYAVSGSPASPATGTIKAALVILDGLTNASGQINDTRSWSSDQNFVGRVRKGTSTTAYKAQPVTGTIDSEAGAALTVQLTPDG
jgi:hypothetical protein